MLWTAPATGIAMCQTLAGVEERRESGYGYKQLSQSALRDGELGAESGPLRRFRLLYARLRTWIGEGCDGES